MNSYAHWAETYEMFEGATAVETWRTGVLPELLRYPLAAPTVLDLGAGTGVGRRTIMEAIPDADVYCLDGSAAMLEWGGIPSERRVVTDMSSFVLGQRFDVVVSGFDSLNYLPPQALADCLRCVATVLSPGGRLVFDYSSRKVLSHDWAHCDYTNESAGYQLRRQHRFDPLTGRNRTRLRLLRDGEPVWDETHDQYAVDPFTIEEFARASGLRVRRVRDIDGEQFTPGHTTHVYDLVQEGTS